MSNNKEIALKVSTSIMNGDWDTLESLLAPEFTYDGDGMQFKRDEYIAFMQDLYLSMRNMKMEFPQIVEEGEFVSIRFVNPVINSGSFMGGPATGKRIVTEGIFIRQIRNGQVIKENQSTDIMGIMTQMGFGALFGYAIAVGLLKLRPKPLVKKSTAEMQRLDAELKKKGK